MKKKIFVGLGAAAIIGLTIYCEPWGPDWLSHLLELLLLGGPVVAFIIGTYLILRS
jgi:hypothetical protein